MRASDPRPGVPDAVARTFLVSWEADDGVWFVQHADRADVFTQGVDLAEARRHALEALAVTDDLDLEDVGPTRFIVDGPVDVA